jgi:hypothetical protein
VPRGSGARRSAAACRPGTAEDSCKRYTAVLASPVAAEPRLQAAFISERSADCSCDSPAVVLVRAEPSG